MSRNKRQPDVVADGSEGSTESSKEIRTDEGCPHLKKSLNDRNVKKRLKKHGITFACEKHGRRKPSVSAKVNDDNEDHDRNVKNDDNGDRNNMKTESCSSDGPLWICLQCMHQSCGESEKNHAMEHFKNTQNDSHCIAVQIHKWDIWCYKCAMFLKPDQSKHLDAIISALKKTPVKVCQKPMNEEHSDKQKISFNYPKVGGIKNLGNTCFFNSVLQCLAQTPFLVDILEATQVPGKEVTIPGKKYKLNDNDEEIELPPITGTLERNFGHFIPNLCKTLREMQQSNGQVIVPNELLNAFKKKSMQCMDGEQHDSHELLRTLLEIVRTEDLKRYKNLILNHCGLNSKVVPEDVKDEKLVSKIKMYGNQVTSTKLLGAELIFRGVLVCTISCCDCKNSVKRKEPFLDLSLPVMADKPQPPVTSKRKNNNADDTFDNYYSGNSVPRGPSKHQLKKEKQMARQRRNPRSNHYDQKSTQNSSPFLSGDDISNTVSNSLESDADVEDNVEVEGSMPDNRESGYGLDESPTVPCSENPLTSLAIPLSYPGFEINNDTMFSPTNHSETSCVKDDITSVQESDSPSAIDISINEHTHDSDDAEVLNNSGNELHVQNGLTNTTSITDKSDSTKLDESTSSSSPLTKNSPTSPMFNAMDVDLETTDTALVPLLDNIESPKDTVKANNQSLTTLENFNSINGQEDIKNPHELCNGINEITSEFSKFEIPSNSHLSCDRYPTSKGECSIQSCLNQFTAPELMTNSNKVACEECTKRAGKNKTEPGKMVCTSSEIQYLISKVPPVLILHLKRFQSQRTGVRKITKFVKFPTILDLAPICLTHKKPRIYSLYGVVVHSGTIHSGHYIAYVKSRLPLKSDDPRQLFVSSKNIKDLRDSSSSDSDSEEQKEEKEEASARAAPTVEPPPGKWYYASDQYVREVTEEDVLKSEAYLLFYERIL